MKAKEAHLWHGRCECRVVIEFCTIDIPSIFDLILASMWIDDVNVVPSTAHKCLKFLHNNHFVNVQGNAPQPRTDSLRPLRGLLERPLFELNQNLSMLNPKESHPK